MRRNHLDPSEYNPFYYRYIQLVDEDHSLIEALKQGRSKTLQFFKGIPEPKLNYTYAKGKWTPLEILQHCLDTERIFSYRALCIARGDQTEFPGFEQDDYVPPSRANERSIDHMLMEYEAVRDSTITLFESLDNVALKRKGMASNSPLSTRVAGFIIAGHEIHHANVILEKYLQAQ